ncbi:hypothetical protein [Alterisphingorhabdus coralli]|uniref:HdeA/HdeB family protein n=1 Tax=Alterisphingorhabdus coralli TaxID=3071408 RepID=A0AA97F9F1_9SPHN|nr:hypothetical protein [Parasphingorhabdus sp. SCSIO 66989]WOE76408.1 hypothetical protein RB602_06755 [Parasphingorhabdus sp. SCSIO 66989]
MKRLSLTIATVAALSVSACAPAGESGDAEADSDTETAADDDMERPDETPAITASDDTMALTCADFLETAAIATAEEQDEAAIAAQDELSNGLIWLHGYLYAANDGEVGVLSQEWMETNVKRVYETCNAAEDPAKVNLFEVAKS